MAKQIIVSFENETIKVIYASSSRDNIEIHKTLVLQDSEFDDFLKKEKSRHFTVVYDFKIFHHDILFLPPAKDRYLKKIIESEIRKKNPELKEFSFTFAVLGETAREGRKGKEAFYFAVDDSELFQIIDRFSRYNKTVRRIYPSVFALASFVGSQFETTEDPALCIAESGLNKTLFLIRNGKLYFIRSARSLESGIHDLDVHDLNMTVNYCRQTLRISPSRIIFMCGAGMNYETTMDFAVPAVCIPFPQNIKSSVENITDFMIPASVVLEDKRLGYADMRPQSYRTFITQKKIIAGCAALLLVLSLAGLGYLKMKIADILKTTNSIDIARTGIRQLETSRSSYETYNKELQKFTPLINFINRVSEPPDMQKALVALSAVKSQHMNDVHIRSIDLNSGTGTLQVQIKGDISAEKFADLRKKYQGLIYEIKKIRGMEISNEKLDLKGKSFQVESRYNVR